MDELNQVPIVPIPGSEAWSGAYDWGTALDERFPDQDAEDFSYACLYNDQGPAGTLGITSFVMRQQGEREEADWIWDITFDDGSQWVATGGCDYTGWDCQSDLQWEQVS